MRTGPRAGGPRGSVDRSLRRGIAACVAAGLGLWVLGNAPLPASAAAPSTGVDPAQAAREVLQGQDYWWKRLASSRGDAPSSPSWFLSLLQAVFRLMGRVLRAIGDLLMWIWRLIARLFSPRGGSGGTAVIWVLVTLLVVWVAWKLTPVVTRWIRGTSTALEPSSDPSWETLPEASNLFEQAGQALGAGQYAEAIRLALLALIARLETQGLLRYDRTRTNREYQRDLRTRAELAACFGQLARIYERVWYGRMAAGEADARQAIRLCESLIHREELAPD